MHECNTIDIFDHCFVKYTKQRGGVDVRVTYGMDCMDNSHDHLRRDST